MMISMSRVRDDTPQPTMSVTDGAAAFSMLCGSGGGTENRVRGGQTCGGRRGSLPPAPPHPAALGHSPAAPEAVPGVGSHLRPRTGLCARHWYNRVASPATGPTPFQEGSPRVTGELTKAAGPAPTMGTCP